MFHLLLLLFPYGIIINGVHFDGGTITWQPLNPNTTSANVVITVSQTYYWTASIITCSTNVPTSTSGRSSANTALTCITGCSTDGGYSTHPLNTLTDCVTNNPSLNLMSSQRSVNISLTVGAHFSVQYTDSAWVAVNYPPIKNLYWSIVCMIDLQLRPDGLINTAPVASIVSPQYAVVNQTILITIPIWDDNVGDHVRCRWAVNTLGSGRRRRSDQGEEEKEKYIKQAHVVTTSKKSFQYEENIHIREKRAKCNGCPSTCALGTRCCCPACAGTTCTGAKCTTSGGCSVVAVTIETPGTTPTTSSYSISQPVDECGGICYPSSLPTGTTLTNCTISFLGPVANAWYGVAIQVEDFLDDTSLTPMSSVPVQFLIYVMDQPTCGLVPEMLPLEICFDVQVGVTISFNMSTMTQCNPNVSDINTIIITSGIGGMTISSTNNDPTNDSVSYATFTWTPSSNQLGSQQLCVMAYTEERLQSSQYCVVFNVISSSSNCFTTITSSSTTPMSNTSSTTSITSSTSTNTTSISISTDTMTMIIRIITTTTTKQLLMWLALFLPILLISTCCSCFTLYYWYWSLDEKGFRLIKQISYIQLKDKRHTAINDPMTTAL